MNDLKLEECREVVFVSHNLKPEGATWSLFYLAKGFKKKGFKASVISHENGPLLEVYRENDIDVKVSDFSSGSSILDKGKIFFVNTILGYKFIKKINLEDNKVIWIIRESEKEIYFEKHEDLRKDLFGIVNKVVFVADATRKIYDGLGNNNFETIHNGIDYQGIDIFRKNNSKSSLRKKHGFSEDEFIFLIVGAVCLRKGQLEFVESAVRLLKEEPESKIKFLIVGGRSGGYESRIREIISDNGAENSVIIIPESPHIFDYYLMSDAYVCNSYIESFPRVILEAMSFELPIISTNVYGIREQIDDNVEGILIMAGDVLALKEKMSYFIHNRDDIKKLGKAGRKKIEEKFNYKLMLKKYIELFDELCAE